ncbi:MAG TPA: DMT family transporter [Micromonosporaceae bacterium]
MLAVTLAAISAAVWGTGDFCGGKAARRADALTVTVIAQLASVPLLAVIVAFFQPGTPRFADAGWGALAGISGFVGIVILYRGLAAGAMAVFAPVTAVTAALVPFVVGLVVDATPQPLAVIGALLAVVAIGLVSVAPTATPNLVTPRLIGLALAAGASFGIFFVMLGQADPHAGIWPLAGARVGAIVVGLSVLSATGRTLRVAPSSIGLALVAGTFDVSANGLYLVAAAHAPLSIVAPIGALYPVSTVLLALAVDRERLRPVQIAGLGIAATALVLVVS